MDPRSEGRIKLKCNQERVERYLKVFEINDVCGDDDDGEFFREENARRANLEALDTTRTDLGITCT